MSISIYPKSTARVRPFRIWDEQDQHVVRGKCFSIVLNAHNAALSHARWYLKVGCTVTVLNADGKVLGQYTRRVHSVSYMGPDNIVAVEKQQTQRGGSTE